MRRLAQALALLVLTTSLAWAWELPCKASGSAGTVAASAAQDQQQPPDQGPLPGACHHCGHLAAHLLGQPSDHRFAPLQNTCVPFRSLTMPDPNSLTDTPLRPPAARLS